MSDERTYPTRNEILGLVLSEIYGGPILNNSHRGDLVEIMVLAALGREWRFVGLGWHPWDLQRGSGDDRVRIQVKQTAPTQLWGKTKRLSLSFGWREKPPSYFARDNPGEQIESCGWFCDIFVFGIHCEPSEPGAIDQADARQWRFLVVPVCDVRPRTKSMVLGRAVDTWGEPVPWHQIGSAVEAAITKNRVGDAHKL